MATLTVKEGVSASMTVELHYKVKNASGAVPALADFKGVIKGNDYYKVVDITGFGAPDADTKSNGTATVANIMTEVGRFTMDFCIVDGSKYRKIIGTSITVVDSANTYVPDDAITALDVTEALGN